MVVAEFVNPNIAPDVLFEYVFKLSMTHIVFGHMLQILKSEILLSYDIVSVKKFLEVSLFEVTNFRNFCRFCEDFSLNKSDTLMKYVLDMAFKGSNEVDPSLMNKCRCSTTAALQVCIASLERERNQFRNKYCFFISKCNFTTFHAL